MIWPLFVVKLILQLLAIGNCPSSIPENIAMQAEAFCSKVIIEDLPSVVTVRRCRGMMRTLSEMSDACRLAKSLRWKQGHTDDTSRKQVCMTSLVIKIKENDAVFQWFYHLIMLVSTILQREF